MKLKLAHFSRVTKNKSKEEILIDTSYTISVCVNKDDQGSRPCGSASGGNRPYITTPSDNADVIGKIS